MKVLKFLITVNLIIISRLDASDTSQDARPQEVELSAITPNQSAASYQLMPSERRSRCTFDCSRCVCVALSFVVIGSIVYGMMRDKPLSKICSDDTHNLNYKLDNNCFSVSNNEVSLSDINYCPTDHLVSDVMDDVKKDTPYAPNSQTCVYLNNCGYCDCHPFHFYPKGQEKLKLKTDQQEKKALQKLSKLFNQATVLKRSNRTQVFEKHEKNKFKQSHR